jgi:predicted P-loop ATPase
MKRAPVPAASLPLDFIDVEGKSGTPVSSMVNTRVAIDLLKLQCRYDVLHDRYSVNGSAFGNGMMQLSDAVARQLREIIRLQFKFDPGPQNAMDGLYRACEANRFNPVLDYLDAREARWDGKRRIDTWLIDYMGADDTPFTRAVGRLMLIASVRRIRVPGCKFDYMTVLHSPEGKGKSSGLSTLYGEENFSDQAILGLKDKELAEAVRGRWAMECSELVGLRKGEIENVKAMITRQTDRGRPAYARAVIDVPRTMVFWGTTNDDEYLRALSGENRRFLPITVGDIDVDAIALDRDQLWGEASAEEGLEGSLSLPSELWAEASAERAGRTQDDPWADVLADVAEHVQRGEQSSQSDFEIVAVGDDGFEQRISSAYVIGVALGIPQERQTPVVAKRAADVMRSLGWSKPKSGGNCRINGKSVRGYVRPYADPFADLM